MSEQHPSTVAPLVDAILKAVNIVRVISVDDNYGPSHDEFMILCRRASDRVSEIPALESIPFETGDDEVWVPKADDLWNDLDDDRRECLLTDLKKTLGYFDKPWIDVLEEIVSSGRLKKLSLREWEESADQLLSDTVGSPTLLLVDEQMDGSSNGMRIIADVMSRKGIDHSRLVCGLLTETAQTETENAARKEHAEDQHLSIDDFLVIAKERLYISPMGFVQRLKHVVLSARCKQLKSEVAQVIEESHDQARRNVDAIDIEQFEQMVFQSALDEGIWEADTLFRIWGIYQRKIARERSRTRGTLLDLTNAIRKVICIPTPCEVPPSKAWEIRQKEMYEDGDYLATCHMPLEDGDVFRKDSGTQWILVGQPCDLMVRPDGKRSGYSHEAYVLKGVNKDTHDRATAKDHFFELPYFEPGEGQHAYVNLSCKHAVKLWVLDLCVFDAEGFSRVTLDQVCPDGLITAWRAHFDEVTAEPKKAIEKYLEYVRKRVPLELADLLLPTSSNRDLFPPQIAPQRSLSYGVRRTGRLLEPYIGALLGQFAAHETRAAFQHDFAKSRISPAVKQDPDQECEAAMGTGAGKLSH